MAEDRPNTFLPREKGAIDNSVVVGEGTSTGPRNEDQKGHPKKRSRPKLDSKNVAKKARLSQEETQPGVLASATGEGVSPELLRAIRDSVKAEILALCSLENAEGERRPSHTRKQQSLGTKHSPSRITLPQAPIHRLLAPPLNHLGISHKNL